MDQNLENGSGVFQSDICELQPEISTGTNFHQSIKVCNRDAGNSEKSTNEELNNCTKNVDYETHLSKDTRIFNVNRCLNDKRDVMSDSTELENFTRKNQVINLPEEYKEIDSCTNCCDQDVPILLADKNVVTTKTIRRTKRIITTKFIAKSKSMDSETLKNCLEKGNFDNIETENPEITMEVVTSEITTLTKLDPQDENKTITEIVYDSNTNTKSLLDCDAELMFDTQLSENKETEERIIKIIPADAEEISEDVNQISENSQDDNPNSDAVSSTNETIVNRIYLNDNSLDLESPNPSSTEFNPMFDANNSNEPFENNNENNNNASNLQTETANENTNDTTESTTSKGIPKSASGNILKPLQSSPSIAAQFNIIAKSRKATVPRCRRTDPPNKSTTRYMTQPVISDKPGSAECLRDGTYVNLTDSGCTNSVQDITMITCEDKSIISSDSSSIESHNLNKYSRSLSGTTRISKESIDGIENTSNRNNPSKKENINEIDNKSEKSYGSEELSGSPENNTESVFYEESKSPSIKSIRRSERHMSGGSGGYNNTRVFQSSLPGTLRRPTPQHIRIHSDEIKAPSAAISDLTTDYLSRKISQTDRKEVDNTFATGPLGPRYSPFRHCVDTGGLDNVVLKSPSAQALMRNSLNRSRSSATNNSNNVRQTQRSINSSERTIDDKDSSINLTNSTDISEEHVLEKGDSTQNIPDEIIIEEVDDSSSIEKQKLEKRYLIIQELLSVESEYVKVLEILVNHYMVPLKLERLLDEAQVDTIFNKIHELMVYHAGFLSILQVWEPKDTIGDKMAQMFSRTIVQDCYTTFIENFSLSEKLLENSLNSKSSLQKFVEQKQKESKNKLPLKALLVQPVQRIPRYELLLKRLIEYTPMNSIDYSYLLEAQTAVHQLAIKINAVKEAKQDESFIEGLKVLDRLLAPMAINQNRQFIRHDAVTVEDRKEAYCLFLFSDQLITTTTKRRGTQTTKKPSVLRLMTPTGVDFVDNIKYKFISRINIENIEFEQNEDTDQKILLRNREMKDRKDLSLLQEIETLVSKLDRKHQDMDNCVKRMYANVLQDMEESRNSRVAPTVNNSTASQFLVTTKEGIERMEFTFSSIEKKQSWEKVVKDLKAKLVDVPRTPRFNQALSITRTQSGMQFCCACPIEGYNNFGIRDVWICQSDGFTGHLCLLSMQADPIVAMNSPLPGCNARVSCIIAVPGYLGSTRRSSLSMDGRFNRTSERKKRPTEDIYQLDTQIEIVEDDPDPDQETGTNVDDSNTSQSCSDSGESETDDTNNKLIRKISSEESPKNKKLSDPFKATMWIGLEDGTILVFYSADNVRMTKSKKKIDLGSAVITMLHFDNRIYVSLLNGELVTFKRHIEGYWDLDYSVITKLTSQTSPIKNLVAVTGFIWGTSLRNIVIINPTSVKIENTFTLSESSDQRPISHLACSGQCVWITQENSTKILLYHATSYEYLCEVNIRPSVIQRLQVWDDIIIRHKEACLRITCLLVCKDVLWAGTSAGVILTIPIPNVTTSTTKANIIQPKVESLDRGHTGNVRFLVSLESSVRSSHPSSRRQSLSPCTTMATQMKIICGGDGYEEFSSKVSRDGNQDIGKDDAINHIQIWDIQ